ncbi:hypothetical protein FB451DRAFT_1217121 [Mycena latifolia]|nr:hypothetical protein FB451DRAFT_1217121 [Mycena latifolia]
MDSCPNEILAAIADFLDEPELFNLRLVGRRLKDVVTRPAYSRLVIRDNIPSVRRFHNLLTGCEDESPILDAVESVFFDGSEPDHFDMGAEPTTELIEAAFSLLYRFPNLHSLRLQFFPGSAPDKNEMYLTYYVEVQLAFWASLTSAPLPRLRTLQIDWMVSYFPRELADEDPFLAVFRSVTTLSLSVVSLYQARRLPDEIRMFHERVRPMLMAAKNVTSLELGADALVGVTSPFELEIFRFPALTSLKLHTFVLAGLPDNDELSSAQDDPYIFALARGQSLSAEIFILNHRATLQRLALEDCAVALPDGEWHRVFRRFRLQLPRLVEFGWSAHSEHPGENFLYARAVGALLTYGLENPDFVFVADDPRDVAALEALQSAVMDRKNKQPT